MKLSDQIRAKMDNVLTAAEAIETKAAAENRPMTAAEQTDFNAKIAEHKSLADEYKAQKQTEDNISFARAARANLNAVTPPAFTYNADSSPYSGGHAANVQARVVGPTLNAFKGQNAERDAYDCGLAFKAVLFRDSEARDKLISRRGEAFYASMNENNPVDGGYAVAPEFSTAVFTAWEQTGAIQKLAKRVPMQSDSLELLKQTGSTTVYYPGEEGEITASDMDFGRVGLVPKKRAILAYMSNELKDDAIVPVMDMLAADMGHQFALKQDQEGILGDGTSTYGNVAGIKTKIAAATASISQAATGHNLWSEIDLADIAAWMGKLPDKFRVEGQLQFLCSQAFKWQVFDRLALSAGGALAMDYSTGVPRLQFLGVPIVTSDRCETAQADATVCAYFGNFGQGLLLGERTQIRIATSEHVAFTSDRLAIRGTTRYDLQVHEPGNTSTAGAIVALKTAA